MGFGGNCVYTSLVCGHTKGPSISFHVFFFPVILVTLFIYKNIVFPAQAEYSYFSADVRLKIFLWIFLDYSV